MYSGTPRVYTLLQGYILWGTRVPTLVVWFVLGYVTRYPLSMYPTKQVYTRGYPGTTLVDCVILGYVPGYLQSICPTKQKPGLYSGEPGHQPELFGSYSGTYPGTPRVYSLHKAIYSGVPGHNPICLNHTRVCTLVPPEHIPGYPQSIYRGTTRAYTRAPPEHIPGTPRVYTLLRYVLGYIPKYPQSIYPTK